MSIHLHFLGTGDAFNTGGRGSACLRAEAFANPDRDTAPGDPPNRKSGPVDGSAFLVDLGPTAIQAMMRERVNPGDIDAVFFTHLHGDHIAGWPFFLLHNSFVTPRSRPLDVYGAKGCAERLAALSAVCYGDVLKPERLPFKIQYHELEVKPVAGLTAPGGLRFDTVPMDHDPTSIGYRFHADRTAFAVSGDTRWCPALHDLSAGCDLLILECTTVRRQAHAHVSLEELREKRGELEAARICLVHTSDAVAEALAKDPIDGAEVAEDGMKTEIT